jgi:hypothetical protein
MEEGLLDKIRYIMEIAKKGTCSDAELEKLMIYSLQHSDNAILGRFFGYSVSDYAIACMKWVNTVEAQEAFNVKMKNIPEHRKKDIEKLISTKIYEEC